MLNLWAVRLTTFMLWALAAGSAAFWVLQNKSAAATGVASDIQTTGSPQTAPDVNLTVQVATALGAKNVTAPTAASLTAAQQARFQLLGVLAVGTKRGAALISIDGKPAKPYSVGSSVEDGLEVTAVAARAASLGQRGATAFTLELPLQK